MGTERNSWASNSALWIGAALGAVVVGTKLLARRSEEDLTGQVALITGGTSGLGLLLAREFAANGCKIVICARDQAELRLARDELVRGGADVLALQCDVADREQVDELIERATNHFGKVDILVNNAGIIQVGPISSMTQDDFKEAMDVMFWGTVFPTMAVLPRMQARKSGRIVNITSIGGKISVPHLLPYNTAKFATVGFSEGLRTELKKDGITVTTIVPGLMRTGSFLNAEFKGEEKKEYLWFSLGSSLPFVSMDAERAATQIVQATRRGDAERILSLPANAIAKLHGVFPGATIEVLSAVERLVLPDGDGRREEEITGREVQERLDSKLHERVTALGQESADRFQIDEDNPPGVWSDPRD
jgi:NAD(P)-dependent dehydrogenase (short-subunit alcohol dehydrogenase family)